MWGWKFLKKRKIKFLWSIILKKFILWIVLLVSMKRPYILYWIVFVPLSKNWLSMLVYLVLGSLFLFFINLYVSLSANYHCYYCLFNKTWNRVDWFIPLLFFFKNYFSSSVPLSFHVTCKMILPISSKILLRYW